jgi:hypothetical protein
MVGIDTYSATGLVSLMQSWVENDTASVMVDSTRFHLDPTCYTILDSLFGVDCINDQAPVTTLPPPTTSTPSVESTTSTPSVKTTNSTPSVKPPTSAPVSGSISAGEIGGIAVGVVIVLLLIILIVVIICRKWRPKVIRR